MAPGGWSKSTIDGPRWTAYKHDWLPQVDDLRAQLVDQVNNLEAQLMAQGEWPRSTIDGPRWMA